MKALSGKPWKGVHELRWKSEGVPHRILGHFTDKPYEFVMLGGCTHNAKKYDPPEILDTILKRKKKVADGEASLNEFKILAGE